MSKAIVQHFLLAGKNRMFCRIPIIADTVYQKLGVSRDVGILHPSPDNCRGRDNYPNPAGQYCHGSAAITPTLYTKMKKKIIQAPDVRLELTTSVVMLVDVGIITGIE